MFRIQWSLQIGFDLLEEIEEFETAAAVRKWWKKAAGRGVQVQCAWQGPDPMLFSNILFLEAK